MFFMSEQQTAHSNKWIIFITVATGTFMALLSASSINVALPIIETEFNASLAGIQWVVTGYLIVISSILPIFGWAGDMTQRKYVIATGFATFGLGALASGLSSSLPSLIVARLLQGLGASMIMANSYAALTAAFPIHQRGQALGMQGSAVALGGISGPAVGGFLMEWLGWRSIFYLVIPFAIIGCIMALIHIPKQTGGNRHKFDLVGAAMLVVMVSSLILALSQWGRPGWSNGEVIFYLLLSLVLAYAFYKWEHHLHAPLVDLKMFQNRVFLNGNLAGLCSFLAISTNTMLLPFYLHRVLDASPKTMGLVLIVFPIMVIMAAPLSGYLSDRYGAPRFAISGMACMTVALLLLAVTATMRALWPIIPALAIFGMGNGMFQSPNNSTTLAVVPVEKHGMAGSIVALMRNFGAVVGTALSVRICDSVSEMYLSSHSAGLLELDAFIRGYQASLLMGAFFAVAGLIFSLSKRKSLIQSKEGT